MDRYFTFQSEIPVSAEEAYAWHLGPGALKRMLPPWLDAHFLFPPARPDQEGGKVGLRLKWGPLSKNWILVHKNCLPNQEFSDVQVEGPFRQYLHRHHFVSDGMLSSRLIDEITYSIPFFSKIIEKELTRYFSWRHRILKDDLATLDRYPKTPLRILLSGSSGFIGSQLVDFLSLAGHEVIRLVREKNKRAKDAIFWDPGHGEVNKEDFEGFDAIIHLAGSGIANKRWTKKNKEQLFLSRCRDTWLLSQILCRLHRPPRTLICASAIGYYGDRKEEELTEESSRGEGFLADLCEKWEKATDAIENRGTRVVHARFGAVLGAKGGMLRKMLGPFRWGMGGRIGSGRQIVSWIGIDDLLGAITHCLMKEEISGPVNLVAPQPVTQAEFTRLLAKKVHRPAFCHVPATFLKLVLGEMANELLLSSQKVKPQKLLETGYPFRYPDLKTALDFVM
jgi:uncharacterized protein (TIGR01777 family)